MTKVTTSIAITDSGSAKRLRKYTDEVAGAKVETWKVATGRTQLIEDLMRHIGSLDMTTSSKALKALDALIDGIVRARKEVRDEVRVAEDDIIQHFGS